MTFHVEAATAPIRLARSLRAAGARAGMALRPATPVEPYVDLLPEFDMVLVMTVEPGFGGQPFLDVCLPKIARARAAIDRSRGQGAGEVWLQVDGGVSLDTIEPLRRGRGRRLRRRFGRLRRGQRRRGHRRPPGGCRSRCCTSHPGLSAAGVRMPG